MLINNYQGRESTQKGLLAKAIQNNTEIWYTLGIIRETGILNTWPT